MVTIKESPSYVVRCTFAFDSNLYKCLECFPSSGRLYIAKKTDCGSIQNVGYSKFFSVNWDQLKKFDTWGSAAFQVFHSENNCMGVATVYGAHNKFHTNVLRTQSFFSTFRSANQ